jgi:hypothetical protein
MTCVLPGWVASAMMVVMILVAGGAGLWTIHLCSRVGVKRHPGITFGDQHSRKLWDSLGAFLGVFIVFPLVAWLLFAATRPQLCAVVGTWQPPPDYSFDMDQLMRDIEALKREAESLQGQR